MCLNLIYVYSFGAEKDKTIRDKIREFLYINFSSDIIFMPLSNLSTSIHRNNIYIKAIQTRTIQR